jgi:hypothetical protein
VEYLEQSESITNKLAIDGPMQADKFSWKQSAQIFLDVANEASR